MQYLHIFTECSDKIKKKKKQPCFLTLKELVQAAGALENTRLDSGGIWVRACMSGNIGRNN